MLFYFKENEIENVAILEAFKQLARILDELVILDIYDGAGTPEAAVIAKVGALYLRSDGGASTTLYVKESGTGNTGWVAK